MYCRENLSSESLNVASFNQEQVNEISCIFIPQCSMYIGCVYRSPLSNPLLFLGKKISLIKKNRL